MDAAVLGVFIPIVAIVGGFAVAIAGIVSRSRVRQLEIRERIAMIERGMVPAPETDPRGFDRAMSRMDHRRGPGRHRRVGIILLAVGFGFVVLIGVAANEPRDAIGIGGMLIMIGLGFLALSYVESGRSQEPPSSTGQVPPQNPPPAS